MIVYEIGQRIKFEPGDRVLKQHPRSVKYKKLKIYRFLMNKLRISIKILRDPINYIKI